MKKIVFGILAITLIFSLSACKSKKNNSTSSNVNQVTPIVEGTKSNSEDEPVFTATTDERMITFLLEKHYKNIYGLDVEEVVPTHIKIYTPEEIEEDEALKSHNLNEGDIAFDVTYDLKIRDGFEDMIRFTIPTGEIDGSWVREKSNLGIARNNGEAGYSLDAFGTGW